ncbi:TIM barrel protein [Prosthecobacter dejongeii]|uniref:Sugar phosphate isomerase/epimerase n=1 Tax=Prosthecobacter dejongeii TaxID=48465 RepID=A0A7W7YJG9_9BACT|nr:sugar phosphate isomerase/epimerase [Prosthecobacter dejongeii]
MTAIPPILSLSTCWNSHRHTEGRALAAEARELGFEWIEVSHGTKISLLPGLLDAVAAKEIKVSSLHNFCPPPVEVLMDAPDAYEFTSEKVWERERAISLTKKTLAMATRFGTDRVVVHLGCARVRSITEKLEAMALQGHLYSRDYSDLKLKLVAQREQASARALDRIRAAFSELLPVCEKEGVKLGIETRSHYEQIPNQHEMQKLMAEYADCPWIGTWHDFGHVQRQANLALVDHAQYLSEIASRLLGCHVHDVRWPMKDHRAPLSTGGVDLANLLPLVPAGVPLVWEMSPGNRRHEVVEALRLWREKFPA